MAQFAKKHKRNVKQKSKTSKSYAMLTHSAMHEQEGMIQLFAAAKCTKMGVAE